MGALTPTIVKSTEFSGDYHVLILTATPAASSDEITLTKATHGISEIVYADAHLTAGLDAELTILQTSYSGLVITVKQLKADGATAADNWTSAALEILVIGKS
jgi:hypothetical protein